MSTISLGKCVSQASKPKERKFVWAVTTVLDSQCFWHEQQVERRKESLELEKHGGKLWSMLEHFWSVLELNTEEPGCQA
jgi:hypothetical protein